MPPREEFKPLRGERSWRRARIPVPDLREVAGIWEPNPISGWAIEPGYAWESVPGWADELIGQRVGAELAVDLEEVGWFEPRASGVRRLRDPGELPNDVRRSAWLAKFNPGLSVGPDAVFADSDPVTFYEWDDPPAALRWAQLTGEPGQTSQAKPHSGAHRRVVNLVGDMAVGDLVFVLRTRPTDSNRNDLPDPLGWKKSAHLVGVWWVEATVAYPNADGWTYPNAYCAPLVKFDEAVPVAKAREWVPELHDVSPLSLPGGVQSLTEGQAMVIAAACSLPVEIFTVNHADLPVLAARLRSLNTGPVEPLRKYLASATVRYERTRDVEVAAMVAIKDLYLSNGYAVADVSRTRRIGYDLAIVHPSREDPHLQVEVKGTDKRTDDTVAITDHEYAAAGQSVGVGDGRWWLYSVTQARHASHRKLHLYTADEVHPAWAERVTNLGAALKNPLKRLDALPPDAWTMSDSRSTLGGVPTVGDRS